MLMILLNTRKCDLTSDLWQQLELACELESDLQESVEWSRKRLVDFNTAIIQLVSFDQSNNGSAIDVKMDRSVFEEKLSFKILGLAFSPKLDWGFSIISIPKSVSKKIGS